MRLNRIVGWSILASVVGWAGAASAGWVIEQMMTGGGEGGRQQIVVQANRMKTVTLGPDGRPVAAFIVDLNADTLTQVDYTERQFMTATLQEYVQMIGGAARAASAQMAGAMKAMEEAMKDLPPEQRKMMEQMLRSQASPAGAPPESCPDPRLELRKTGRQATIAGYPAGHYEILADGKLDSEMWVAPGIGAWRELDPAKLERFAAAMTQAAPACGRGPRRQGVPGADPAWKLAGEGYPVRTVTRSLGLTVEVVKAESRAVPAAEFQPPPNFARKALREMLGQ
ncbi:MAG: DUF4412 domain-containing protein [Candidatus Rokubacteria bacterium]|nr:DUF4412 domain-containing protein [Candidatus Rokubacteria bacterium]